MFLLLFFGFQILPCLADPNFRAPISNVTVRADEEANITCVVDDLSPYSVRKYYNYNYVVYDRLNFFTQFILVSVDSH